MKKITQTKKFIQDHKRGIAIGVGVVAVTVIAIIIVKDRKSIDPRVIDINITDHNLRRLISEPDFVYHVMLDWDEFIDIRKVI